MSKITKVLIIKPGIVIEGLFSRSIEENSPAALILHPDPVHGGDMNHKVVFNMYKALAACNFSVLRINFRGVGRSRANKDTGNELSDATFALDWLQDNHLSNSLFLICGFSFGAWISMQLIMRRPEIKNFIAVSPPVNKYDFSSLAPCPCNGLIVQGDQDSIVPEKSVSEFANRINIQKNVDYHVIQGADHFFRNKLNLLNDSIREYAQNKVLKENESVITKKSKQRLYL